MDIPLWPIPLWPALAAAAVCIGFGTWTIVRGRQGRQAGQVFKVTARTARAEVTELRLKYGYSGNVDGGSGAFFPVVRFTLPDGRVVEAETMTGAHPAPARVGKTVQVRYDPDNPHRVSLAKGMAQPGNVGTFQVGMGCAIIAVGALVLGFWALIVLVLEIPL